MGLLNYRKKNEQLRTLTEKEIQEKLYGRFRLSHKEDTGISSMPPRNSASLATIEKVEEKSSDLFAPSISAAQPGFSQKNSRVEFEPQEKEIKKSFADVKSDITASPSKMHSRPAVFTKPASRPVSRPKQAFFAGFLKILQGIGGLIGKALGSVVVVILKFAGAFLEAILIFLKKGQNRYWVGAIVFLSILLGSIHHLNVQREIAMKTPRSRPVAPMVQARNISESPAPVSALAARLERAPAAPLSPTVSTDIVPGENVNALTPSEPASAGGAQGAFVIQVVTYATQADGTGLLKRLNQDGFSGLVKQSTRNTGKIYYTVFVGRFKTYREAQENLAQFQKKEISKPFQDAFIRTLQ